MFSWFVLLIMQFLGRFDQHGLSLSLCSRYSFFRLFWTISLHRLSCILSYLQLQFYFLKRVSPIGILCTWFASFVFLIYFMYIIRMKNLTHMFISEWRKLCFSSRWRKRKHSFSMAMAMGSSFGKSSGKFYN